MIPKSWHHSLDNSRHIGISYYYRYFGIYAIRYNITTEAKLWGLRKESELEKTWKICYLSIRYSKILTKKQAEVL